VRRGQVPAGSLTNDAAAVWIGRLHGSDSSPGRVVEEPDCGCRGRRPQSGLDARRGGMHTAAGFRSYSSP
jgi:hypothetical protein